MKNIQIPFLFALLIWLGSCSSAYVSSNFEERSADHQLVAVLPFEMIYTGVRPEDLTEDDIREIGIAESKAFQISFFNEILRSTRSGKKPIRVDIQDHQKTLNLLEENGIGIEESWAAPPEKLADILGVDAVVKARIQKTRLMSDLASYGIEVGTRIINVLTNYRGWWLFPYGASKSKEIQASYSLLDKKDGTVLWSIAFDVDADWRQRANEIIDNVNRRGAKKFPYRMK